MSKSMKCDTCGNITWHFEGRTAEGYKPWLCINCDVFGRVQAG